MCSSGGGRGGRGGGGGGAGGNVQAGASRNTEVGQSNGAMVARGAARELRGMGFTASTRGRILTTNAPDNTSMQAINRANRRARGLPAFG